MGRFGIILGILATCMLAGCGISQKTKDGANAVWGYDGINDQFMDAATTVINNQIIIMQAISDQHGPDFELMITRADGAQATVKVKDWIAALKTLAEYPPKLKKAAHAVNDAVQADKGLSAFTEQLLRTLEGESVLGWFLGGGD